jgi:hypothetical protein
MTPEEHFSMLKLYDTKKNYTFYKPEDELREGVLNWLKKASL